MANTINKKDFHMHTIFSDGRLTPFELAEKAKKFGLEKIAITDHDTVKHLEEVKIASEKTEIAIVLASEITAQKPAELGSIGKSYIHILALGIKNKSKLEKICSHNIKNYIAKKEQMLEKNLSEIGRKS